LIALSLFVDIALPGLNAVLSTAGLSSPFAACCSPSSSSSVECDPIADDLALFGSRYIPVSYMALTLCDSISTSSARTFDEGETSREKLGAPSFTTLVRTGRLTAFFPPSITLPLFEKDSLFRKSSSSRLSVGMLVLIGVKFSTEAALAIVGGVLGLLLLLEEGLLQRLEFSKLKLPPLVTFTSGSVFAGVSGALWTFSAGLFTLALALKLAARPRPGALLFSSTVLTEPSRALDEVVGASPESLFQPSSSLISLFVRRRAGCISVGGALGGATVTGIGGFAGSVSS
jgi:hypothetical protein